MIGLLGSLAGACTDPAPPGGPFVSSRSERKQLAMPVPAMIDVLVVIDRSPAMAAHRDRVIAQVPQLAATLEAIPLAGISLQLGVVTSDLGAEGVAVPGCTADGEGGRLRTVAGIDGAFLVDAAASDGSRVRNYEGSLADAFVRLADVGAQGCPYSRPLAAARRALGDEPANAGFLRPDAYLAVIFITAQDDCSFADAAFLGGSTSTDTSRCTTMASALPSIADDVQFLKSLKPDPTKVVVGGILSPATAAPACTTSPAPRLRALLEMFPNRSSEASICGDDHAAALALIAELPRTTLGYPCWEAPIADLDPATPGTQFDCAAWYQLGAAGGEEHTLPVCGGTPMATPCWRLLEDDDFCPSAFALEIETGATAYADGGLATVECLVADPS